MTLETQAAEHQPESAPRIVRWIGYTLAAMALGGSAYLIWARGEAMLVDLAALGAKIFCF